MNDPGVHALAHAAGLSTEWTDYRGQSQQVGEDVLRQILEALEIASSTPEQRAASFRQLAEETDDPRLPLITALVGEPIRLPWRHSGRYRIELEEGGRVEGHHEAGAPLPAIDRPGYHSLMLGDDAPLTLAVAPSRCFGIGDLGVGRTWGLTAQIYGLRRRGDAGIGDLGGVAALARSVGPAGADAIAISPVHALFASWPERHGPYAPSTRLLRNPLLADPALVFGESFVHDAVQAAGIGEAAAALEAQPLVDAARAAPLKYALIAALHTQLDQAPQQREAFAAYRRDAGSALHDHACFEVLHAHFLKTQADGGDWRRWPGDYRDPRTAAVTAFAQRSQPAIELQMFAQWLADRSLECVQRQARDAGMRIGLIGDLAVGTDSAGSHAWSRQQDMLIGLRIGAPPDLLNVKGQDWGLGAFSPRALRRHGYTAFIELLRASLRHVGGIRLDHVFGLQRLWLIPGNASANEGAYLEYPIGDLLRLIALESWRHRAIVVGEDLGTMPEGFQQHIDGAGMLGMRVMWFQRDHGFFIDPGRWPEHAAAMTTTHDLPTVAGWWLGRDIEWRARLDLLEPGSDEAAMRVERERERTALWDAFAHAGVAGGPPPGTEQGGEVARAAAAFIGRTPARLALLPVEDALALTEQPNIPGTTDEHPNWQRRLPCDVESAFAAADVRARLAALDEQRRSGS
jgi:4-alpha-glucanotransferase